MKYPTTVAEAMKMSRREQAEAIIESISTFSDPNSPYSALNSPLRRCVLDVVTDYQRVVEELDRAKEVITAKDAGLDVARSVVCLIETEGRDEDYDYEGLRATVWQMKAIDKAHAMQLDSK
jgi:predicted Zn-dependent protease